MFTAPRERCRAPCLDDFIHPRSDAPLNTATGVIPFKPDYFWRGRSDTGEGYAGGGYFVRHWRTVSQWSRFGQIDRLIRTFLAAGEAPAITRQPQSQTVAQGKAATLSVSAGGTALRTATASTTFNVSVSPVQIGAFGITSFGIDAQGIFHIYFLGDTNHYYILYKGATVLTIANALAMALGVPGTNHLQDSSPANTSTASFYKIASVPLAQFLDADGDGIPDAFELMYPACLNPLNPGDGALDCDGDGLTNLAEYQMGTNPTQASPPPPPAPIPPASERYANTSRYHEFPRWHASINVLNKSDPLSATFPLSNLKQAAAVDPRGFLVVVGISPANSFPGALQTVPQVACFDTRSAFQRANGFSEPFNVSATDNIPVDSPDVRAMNDGSLFVGFERGQSAAAGLTVTDIYVRRRDAAGQWADPLPLTNNPDAPSPGFVHRFQFPRIIHDSVGNVHMTIYEYYDKPGDLILGIPSVSYRAIHYAENPQSGGMFTPLVMGNVSGTIAAGDFPASFARISVARSDNQPRIVWTQQTPAGMKVLTMARVAGAWVGPLTVAENASSADITVDSLGDSSFVYRDEGTGEVLFKKTPTGILESLGPGGDAQILHDSRDQPNVVWNGPLGVSYARKVKGQTWTFQKPIPELLRSGKFPSGGLRLALDSSDRLYVVDDRDGLCSWTYEPNLGDQDSFVTFPWGPSTSVNVATGNVDFGLTLFAARGVGFASDMALRHNTREPHSGDLSSGWTHNHRMRIIDSATGLLNPQDTLTLVFGDGRSVIARFKPDLGYDVADPEYGYFSRIERTAGGIANAAVSSSYRLTTKFGIVYLFDAAGRLIEVRDTQPSANTMTYHHDANPNATEPGTKLLLSIIDSAGRITKLAYDAFNRLTQITDPANGIYTINYETTVPLALGKLSAIRFASGEGIPTWKFDYFPSNNHASGMKSNLLARVYTPSGSAALPPYSWEFRYYPDGRALSSVEPQVLSITDESNPNATPLPVAAWRLVTYNDPSIPGVPNTLQPVPRALFTDRRGYETEIRYQYMRCLADQIIDAQSPAGEIRRYFDGFNFVNFALSAPQYRDLTHFVDKRGATTVTLYHATAFPPYVRDNVAKVFRPKTIGFVGDSDPTGNTVNFTPPREYSYTTDGLNRLARSKDSRDSVTTYLYDAAGNRTNIIHSVVTDPDENSQSASQSLTYDSRGRVLVATDAEGNSSTDQYNDLITGLLTHQLLPGGTKWEQFVYDTMGNTRTNITPEGSVTVINYDGRYLPVSEVDPIGATTFYERDLNGNTVVITNPRGYKITNVLDRLDRPVAMIIPAGVSKSLFDREGNERKTQSPNAVIGGYFDTLTLYDPVNRRKEVHRTTDGPEEVAIFEHDRNGNLTVQTEIGLPDRVTEQQFDARDNLIKRIYPITTISDHYCFDDEDNQVLSRRYNSAEQPPLGPFKYGTLTAYDQRNRVKTITQLSTDPDPNQDCVIAPGQTLAGFTTKYFLNRNSFLTKVVDPSGKFMEFVPDARSRPFQTKDGSSPAPIVLSETEYTEDDQPKVEKFRHPATDALIAARQMLYNARHELIHTVDVFGHTNSFGYDANGNLTNLVDPAGVITAMTYDAADRVTEQVQDAGGLNIKEFFAHDANGNRTNLVMFNPATAAYDGIYSFLYDKADRLIETAFPLTALGTEKRTYNRFGQVATYTDRNGKVRTNSFDLMGRLMREVHQGAINQTIGRTYDGANNLTKLTNNTTQITYTYGGDNRNLLASVVWNVENVFLKTNHYAYGLSGERTNMIDPEGALHAYAYDHNLRPTTFDRNGFTHATMAYTPGGLRKYMALGNGATNFYAYDAKLRLTNISTLSSSGAVISEFIYSYDGRDNRTNVFLGHLGVNIAYSYDNASRLIGEVWTPMSASSSVPAFFAFYSYGLNGNRVAYRASNRQSTYHYDAENRLIQEFPAAVQKWTNLSATASSTDGLPASVAIDSNTTPSAFWKSQPLAQSEHALEVTFLGSNGTPTSLDIGQVRLYFPPSAGGVARFKVQFADGPVWKDTTNLAVIGASPATSAPSWYSTTNHEVVFGFQPVTALKARFLQGAAGGGTDPNVAYLNEFEVYPFIAQSPIAYAYDNNGNLTNRAQGVVQEFFGYDYKNRLASYERKSGGLTVTNFTYLFAPTGDRVRKHNISANAKEWFAYDERDVVTDYAQAATGSIQNTISYAQALGIDSKFARITHTSGETNYYATDALRSVHQVLDASQIAANVNLTTAFGEDLPDFASGGSIADRHGFTGRERDTETKTSIALMHYRARTFDPKLGRFIQKDSANPLAEHYLYARNRPLAYTDPSGFRLFIPDDVPNSAKWPILQTAAYYYGYDLEFDGTHVKILSEKGSRFSTKGDADIFRSWVEDDEEHDLVLELQRGYHTYVDPKVRYKVAEAWSGQSEFKAAVGGAWEGANVGAEAFVQGFTLDLYQAPEWAQKDPMFKYSRGIGTLTLTTVATVVTAGGASGATLTGSATTGLATIGTEVTAGNVVVTATVAAGYRTALATFEGEEPQAALQRGVEEFVGRAARPPAGGRGPVHGNALNSPRPAYLYSVHDKVGNFQGWGISQNPATRYRFKQGELLFVWGKGPRKLMESQKRELIRFFAGPLNKRWAGWDPSVAK